MINIITGISVAGIAVGSCALLLVMSVFNGFHDLLYSLFNSFNPPAKVSPVQGKVFEVDSALIYKIKSIPGVTHVSISLEETAMFEYDDQRYFGTIKGVDDDYVLVNNLDSVIVEGEYATRKGNVPVAVLGAGVEAALGVDVSNEFTPLKIHMPKRNRRNVALEKSFYTKLVYPVGVFSFQQDFDRQYVITSLETVRDLLNYDWEASYLEISFNPDYEEEVFTEIKQVVGDGFNVQNRYEQEASFLKIMNGEKWMAFAILCLTLLLVAFNLVGALWMIVLEKQKDISILKTMGASSKMIRNIFLHEGMLVSGIGLLIGFGLALLIYFLQVQFSIIPIREGFIVDSYPIAVKWFDFFAGAIAVMAIGFIASILPAMKADKVGAYIREE